jgi:hypothetical protein
MLFTTGADRFNLVVTKNAATVATTRRAKTPTAS